MTSDTAAPTLAATARNVMDRIRYMVLDAIDEDGCTRTSSTPPCLQAWIGRRST
jgi:hypothetical protein